MLEQLGLNGRNILLDWVPGPGMARYGPETSNPPESSQHTFVRKIQ